jgi:hypothetical protein
MKLIQELYETILEELCEECGCEVVYTDEDGNVIEEAAAAAQAFRRKGNQIKKQFRCTTGEKKGRLVANPKTCLQRKNPKRMIVGKKVAAAKKGLRLRKSAITRKSQASKQTRKANLRLKHMSTRKPKTR